MSKRRVFVTGISKGIGRAICSRLSIDGYEVYGTYKDENELQEINELLKIHNDIKPLQADFCYRQQIDEVIKAVDGVQFDAIVNNAGMFAYEDFGNFDVEIWDTVLGVNLYAVAHLSTHLQKNIKQGGSIVIISSGGGYMGSFNSISYCASKAGLINLTKSLANNYGRNNIRVNSIAPGWINTGMATPESYEAAEKSSFERNGLPDEVADVVKFLVSDKSSFITGAIISVDGGYSSVDYILKKEALSQHKDSE